MARLLRNVLISAVFVWLINRFLASKEPGAFLAHGVAGVVGVVVLALLILAGWYYFRYLVPLRKKEPGFTYVYVNADGTVREVTEEEQQYLQTEFHPADGGRPNIKSRYDEKNGYGSLQGFIERRRVPATVSIRPYSQAS